jgi:hypothetical protein
MLTEDSLDFAQRHIRSFYDTDFYPKPFEYRALWYFWKDVKKYLLATPLAALFSAPPKTVAWPKARGGYRVVHQLEPLDAITYIGLVHAVAQQISDARMGPEIACSYRIDLDHSSFFSEGSGFSVYRRRCEQLSEKYEYVLSTDISDFYNQIYLHRVGNAVESAAPSTSAGKEIEAFISRLNNKASQGIPVGPSPSVILAEALMIDVDQHILNAGFEHVRYVDDIRIFSDSKKSLEIFLEELVIYLHDVHRLNIVGEKTGVRKTSEFLHSELQNQYQLEKLDILRDIEVANPYSMHYEFNDDEVAEEDEGEDGEENERSPGEVLRDALTRARNFGLLDLAVIRAIIRRAKAHVFPDLAAPLIDDIEFFAPAANDVALYLAALPDHELEVLRPKLGEMCHHGDFDKQCVKTWMEWLFSQKPVLMQDANILKFLFSRGSIPAQSLAAVRNKNIAWAKSAKGKILTSASWNRRAYLYSLSVLSADELKFFIGSTLKHHSLTPTDKWVARWVEAGCPDWTLDWDDDLPF